MSLLQKTVYLSDETAADLQRRAEEEEMSVTGLILRYIDEGLARPSKTLIRVIPQFTRAIFLGNGTYSARQCQDLHNVVDEALSHLSGLQQPSMSTDEPRPREDGDRELVEYMQNICTAFGYNVHAGAFEKLP